jgi:ATP-dependent RNA helicase DHX8/PRP22
MFTEEFGGRDRSRSRDRDREIGRGREGDRDRDRNRATPRVTEDRGRSSDKLPLERSIYRGRIVKIESFGAFVEMEGFRSNGLVHISHIARDRVEDINEVITINQEVYVKVLCFIIFKYSIRITILSIVSFGVYRRS